MVPVRLRHNHRWKGIEPGRLLSGYVERSLKNPAIRGVAVEILRPLVTDVATKRALPIDRIAEAARVPRMVARGCLIALANDGLVRPLDKGGDQWEVAHDFVARLLQPIVRNWRKSAWQTARPWLAPAALSGWLVAAVATIVVFPSLYDDLILRDLRTVGLVPGAPNDQGSATFSQNGRPIEDQKKFWRVASRMADLGYVVAGLTINNRDLTTLDGMPALPALTTLSLSQPVFLKELNPSIGLTSLQGMPALPALTKLDLSGTILTSLQGMPALPALTSLDLSNAGLTSLQDMPALPALTQLSLSNASLTSLQGMPALPALTSLDLSHTGVTSLQGMPTLPALTELDLSNTGLRSLQGMPSLPALTKLKLMFARGLTSLQGMPALPQVRGIYLTNLQLEGLDQLKSLPKLEEIIVVTREQIDLTAVPEEIRSLVVTCATSTECNERLRDKN